MSTCVINNTCCQ